MDRPPFPPPDILKPFPFKPFKFFIRPFTRTILAWVDARWSHWTSLRTHLVICGFPRSGTTLAQLMAQCCVPGIKCFDKEIRALEAAQCALRNHEYMITKAPRDIFLIPEIRDYYKGRQASPRFVLFNRDPRAVLTSFHADRPGEYYVSPQRWRAIDEHWRWVTRDQPEDLIIVRYEELMQNPDAFGQQLESFVGWKSTLPFSQFHTVNVGGFKTDALNGLRPVDPTNINRWRDAKHHERLRWIVQEMPELPQRLIEMGYDTNTDWVKEIQ